MTTRSSSSRAFIIWLVGKWLVGCAITRHFALPVKRRATLLQLTAASASMASMAMAWIAPLRSLRAFCKLMPRELTCAYTVLAWALCTSSPTLMLRSASGGSMVVTYNLMPISVMLRSGTTLSTLKAAKGGKCTRTAMLWSHWTIPFLLRGSQRLSSR